jgi:hypothetical protein
MPTRPTRPSCTNSSASSSPTGHKNKRCGPRLASAHSGRRKVRVRGPTLTRCLRHSADRPADPDPG